MSLLVFIDTNVFIWGYNRSNSNSDKILELMSKRDISVIISEKVLEQLAVVKKFGIKYLISYDKDFEPFED